ncbi:hypothetical protein ACU6U9_04050 [Pseudomonas sp. HK3]
MNRILTMLLIISFCPLSWADNSPKYKRGDCITPVVKSYSWYGKYATVEAYSIIEGFTKNKSYILAFPLSGSNSTIFDKEIESVTKKVNFSLCGK